MDTAKFILAIVQLVICVGLIVVVIFQPGRTDGLSGSISGSSSETFFSKNKGKSWEKILAKITTYTAVAFMVISVILYALK